MEIRGGATACKDGSDGIGVEDHDHHRPEDSSRGGEVMVIESMKMEIPVIAEHGGTVVEFCVAEGAAISEGEVVAILEG